MKTKTTGRRLVLNKTTVSRLSNAELKGVHGGDHHMTMFPGCIPDRVPIEGRLNRDPGVPGETL